MGSVDDALAALPGPAREALQRVIAVARAAAPDAVDGVSYGMPALKVRGQPLIGVTASAKHLSVFPFSAEVVQAVAHRLEGFSVSKGTIRFTADHPVPPGIVAEIVRLRLLEIP
ncbi:MAG TPA: DUF1801 domain-containing protein [Arthrobacter sp.]|nr:DUF1801 domain-containing protein [Arthrobacter sp.]